MAKKSKKSQLEGFMDFIREQGVIALAIGLILGVAVKDVVSGLVDGIINPIVGLILPNTENLGEAAFKIGDADIVWGALASPLLDLIVIAAVIYFGVKGLGLNKLDKKD